MGWWSADVMGGDAPLDWVGDLAEACGVEYDYDNDDRTGTIYGFPLTKEIFLDHYYQMVGLLKEENDPVGWEVFGELALKFDIPITKDVLNEIDTAIEKDKHDWEDDERTEVLNSLANDVLTLYENHL